MSTSKDENFVFVSPRWKMPKLAKFSSSKAVRGKLVVISFPHIFR